MILTGGFTTLTDLTGGPEGLTVLTDLTEGPSGPHGFDGFDAEGPAKIGKCQKILKGRVWSWARAQLVHTWSSSSVRRTAPACTILRHHCARIQTIG